MKTIGIWISASLYIFLCGNCGPENLPSENVSVVLNENIEQEKTWGEKVAAAAESIIDPEIVYDPAYVQIPYPNGDVDPKTGVCTDVVIRTYRELNIDLQKLVHEDMKEHFDLYPNNWSLNSTDRNIDHRRVPNLMTFFERHGTSKPNSLKPNDFEPGDIVTWDLGGGILHIGIVSNNTAKRSKRKKVIHNIGTGQIEEDILSQWKITGHFNYYPTKAG